MKSDIEKQINEPSWTERLTLPSRRFGLRVEGDP